MVLKKWVKNWFGSINHGSQKMGQELVRTYYSWFLMLTAGSFMRTVGSLRVLKYPKPMVL
jgi:hypothetical protein